MSKSRRSRGLSKITEKDELKHEWKKYPEHHNESWYFNSIDLKTSTNLITRVGYRMGTKNIEVMFLIILDKDDDEKNLEYFNRTTIEGYPEDDIYGDEKVKYQCIEPMKKWRLTFNNEKFEVDVICEKRFPPYIYMSQEDPKEIIEKYGKHLDKLLKVAANFHYEQGINITGVIRVKKNGQIIEEREVKSRGHRDHSWGTRDWVLIDGWNWICCQSNDFTMNFSRVRAFGFVFEHGFISTADGHEHITNVEVETEYGFKGNESVPKSSTFKVTTPSRQFTIISNTWKSIYMARPTERGITEVYEQIVHFDLEGKKGVGISEYMSSTKK